MKDRRIKVSLVEANTEKSLSKFGYPGSDFLSNGVIAYYPYLPRKGDVIFYESCWWTVVNVWLYPSPPEAQLPPQIQVEFAASY